VKVHPARYVKLNGAGLLKGSHIHQAENDFARGKDVALDLCIKLGLLAFWHVYRQFAFHKFFGVAKMPAGRSNEQVLLGTAARILKLMTTFAADKASVTHRRSPPSQRVRMVERFNI
jgi:hypothetical protein